MKILVLCLVAAVWLQLPNGGSAKKLFSQLDAHSKPPKSPEVPKRTDKENSNKSNETNVADHAAAARAVERSAEFRAFQESYENAVENGGFDVGYFDGTEWKAFRDTMLTASRVHGGHWSEAGAVESLKAVARGYVKDEASDYQGNFFESPQWKDFKLASVRPSFDINDMSNRVVGDMLAAARVAYMEDPRFMHTMKMEYDKFFYSPDPATEGDTKTRL